MTYDDLCKAMQRGEPVTIKDTRGYINGISREDGSGKNWIITMAPVGGGDYVKHFVRAG